MRHFPEIGGKAGFSRQMLVANAGCFSLLLPRTNKLNGWIPWSLSRAHRGG